MENAYKITGGNPVSGRIRCLGAKNFVTKAMVAALLSDEPTTLTNVPDIGDVDITLEMIESVGVKTEYNRVEHTLTLYPSYINRSGVPMPDSGSNRIPILLLGPLMHRFKEAHVPVLGGCNIGARKVDFHLSAIEQFGGIVEDTDEGIKASVDGRLKATHIDLPYPSVGATETCLLLGVLAEGSTVVTNIALEPEIQALITMLRSMGAIIFTYPERKIKIEGVKSLSGTIMHVLGDRIEGASWACLAAATNGDIVVEGLQPDTLGNFLPYFQQVGGGFELLSNDAIRFYRKEKTLKPAMIETDVYPGFSTDWQQPFAILLTQAEGVSVMHETVYENRFGYLKALNNLGAKTQLSTYCLGTACRFQDKGYEHSAIITGKTTLKATSSLEVPDLRAGVAYIIATAIAEGTTIVKQIQYIERGYGDLVERMKGLSISIEKIQLQETYTNGVEAEVTA